MPAGGRIFSVSSNANTISARAAHHGWRASISDSWTRISSSIFSSGAPRDQVVIISLRIRRAQADAIASKNQIIREPESRYPRQIFSLYRARKSRGESLLLTNSQPPHPYLFCH